MRRVSLVLLLLGLGFPAWSEPILILDMRGLTPLPEPPPAPDCPPALVRQVVISVVPLSGAGTRSYRGWPDIPAHSIDALFRRASETFRSLEPIGIDLRVLRNLTFQLSQRRYLTDKTSPSTITSGDEWGRILIVMGALHGVMVHKDRGGIIPNELQIVRDALLEFVRSQKPLLTSYLELETALGRVLRFRNAASLATYMGLQADDPVTHLTFAQ